MANEQSQEKGHQDVQSDELKEACPSAGRVARGVSSRMADLTLGGMSIETPEPPPVGTIVDLLFDNSVKEIRARALVRRIVPHQGMDVEFVGMGNDDRARLRALLRAAEKAKRPGSGPRYSAPGRATGIFLLGHHSCFEEVFG